MIADLLTLAWLLLTLFCALCIKVRDDRLANIEAARDLLLLALADVREERDTLVGQLQWRETQIAGHVRDWETLMHLTAEGWVLDDTDDLIAEVESFLSEALP